MANNPIDREFNDRLIDLTNKIARNTPQLEQALRESTKRLVGAQDDVVSSYEAELEARRGWNTKEAKELKSHLVNLRRIEEAATKAKEEHAKRTDKISDELQKIEKKLKDVKIDEPGTTKKQRVAAKAQKEELDSRKRALLEQQALAQQEHQVAIQAAEQAAARRGAIENTQLRKTAAWGDAFRSKLQSTAQNALQGALSSFTFSKALKDVVLTARDATEHGMKTGGYGIGITPESMGGGKFNVAAMAQYGMNSAEAIKMQAEQRKVIVSTRAGMNEFMDGLKEAHEQFADTIADPAERTKVAIDSMAIANKAGIRMSKQQSTMFLNSSKQFSKYTGKSASEFTDAVGEIINSSEVQNQLATTTNEGQRKAILDGIHTQIAHNSALGISIEQTKAMAKAMAEVTSKKPEDVIKDTANLQALGGALGMGKQAKELAQLQNLREDASPEQRARMAELQSEMRNKYDQMGRGKVSGRTLAVHALGGGLDVDRILSKTNNTVAANAVSPQDKAFETLPEIPAELKNVTAAIRELQAVVEKNPIGQLAAGGIGSIASITLEALGTWKAAQLGLQGLSKIIPGLEAAASAEIAASSAGAVAMGETAAAGAAVAETAGAATAAAVLAPLLAMWGVKEWVEDQSHDQERVGGLLGVSDALKSIMPDWMGDPSKSARAKYDAQRAELDGTGGEYANLPKPITNLPPSASATAPMDARNQQAADAKAKTDAEAAALAKAKAAKQDVGNDTLKKIAELTQKQIELAEKQLLAMSMTDQERGNAENKAAITSGTRIANTTATAR